MKNLRRTESAERSISSFPPHFRAQNRYALLLEMLYSAGPIVRRTGARPSIEPSSRSPGDTAPTPAGVPV